MIFSTKTSRQALVAALASSLKACTKSCWRLVRAISPNRSKPIASYWNHSTTRSWHPIWNCQKMSLLASDPEERIAWIQPPRVIEEDLIAEDEKAWKAKKVKGKPRANQRKPKSSLARRISPVSKISLRLLVADGTRSVLTQTDSRYWSLVAYIVAYCVRFNEKQQCESR